MPVLQQFFQKLASDMQQERFVKLSLGNYHGTESGLKKIYIKPVLIKRALNLSFVYRYANRDVTKNYSLQDAQQLIRELLSQQGFRTAHLATLDGNVVCEFNKSEKWVMRTEKSTAVPSISLSHDKVKSRKLSAEGKSYLHELRLTDPNGKVYKNAQDKWKQINHYIELLNTELENLPHREKLKVVDMGSGKGYLTFALYDYLNNVMQKPADILGVEYRKDMVDLCNAIANRAQMEGLTFVEGGIENFESAEKLDVLIALHACDVATDEAIFKGITHDAHLIVTAPCCHKQIRRELEKNKPSNDLDFINRHGIFLERQAEMLTDSLRALLLEYAGYRTKVVQFISDAHTPKNIMIIAVKGQISPQKQQDVREKLKHIKSYFGIGYHHLERLMGVQVH